MPDLVVLTFPFSNIQETHSQRTHKENSGNDLNLHDNDYDDVNDGNETPLSWQKTCLTFENLLSKEIKDVLGLQI